MIGRRSALLAAVGLRVAALAAPAAAQDQPTAAPDTPAAAPASAPAAAGRRVAVAPYIEVDQILDAEITPGDDVVTYTDLSAGVDVAVSTARVTGQLSYRYEHRFDYDRYSGDEDVHTGLAVVNAAVARGLSLEAGGLATRTRANIGGAAPGLLTTSRDDNISQLYSVYAGPTLAETLGALSVNGAYRIGYTKVKAPNGDPTPGVPFRDNYDHSLDQVAAASIGFAPRTVAPFGATLSGGWARDDADQLKQRYLDRFVRGDGLLPVSAYLALTGGVGYEKLTTSEKDPLVDATGNPVTDSRGRYVTDPASPRRITYRTDGLYYDAGVVWRPNRRTSIEGHVGHRYGSMTYFGTATYQASPSSAASVRVYDSVEVFGHQLEQGVSTLPTSFVTSRDAYLRQFNGCVFGTNGTGAGGCLNQVFQSLETASYRARGVDAVVSVTRGVDSLGVGAGYANRKLFDTHPVGGVSLYGLDDESYYGEAFWGRQLSRVSTLDATAFVNYYDPAGVAQGVWSYGATGSYTRRFGHLDTNATVGLYVFKVGDFSSQLSAQALLGARYTF